MRRSGLDRRTPLRTTVELARKTELVRKAPIAASSTSSRPRPRSKGISPASPAQRAKCRNRACVVCRQGPCVPAHIADRSLGGCDDPLCTIPLCARCHRAYDDDDLDLLPHLEPHYRDELAHAITHLGLLAALQRVTNTRWRPAGT